MLAQKIRTKLFFKYLGKLGGKRDFFYLLVDLRKISRCRRFSGLTDRISLFRSELHLGLALLYSI